MEAGPRGEKTQWQIKARKTRMTVEKIKAQIILTLFDVGHHLCLVYVQIVPETTIASEIECSRCVLVGRPYPNSPFPF
jgi:hypothetical protein